MNILWQVFYKVSAFVNSPEFLRSFFDNRFYLISAGDYSDAVQVCDLFQHVDECAGEYSGNFSA